jgi:hypothetical protein
MYSTTRIAYYPGNFNNPNSVFILKYCSNPRKICYFVLFHSILHLPTVDCGEELRHFPQPDTQEGRITYTSHFNSKTAETARNCCWVTKVIADVYDGNVCAGFVKRQLNRILF